MSHQTISKQLKTALITAGMSATLALISANAWSSEGRSYEDKQAGDRSSHHEKEDHVSKHQGRMVKKMDELKTTLNLRADQATAWEAFAGAMVKERDHKKTTERPKKSGSKA